MGLLIVCAVFLIIGVMIAVSQRQQVVRMKRQLRAAQDEKILLENKVNSSHQHLKKNKEEIERNKQALKDARELNKKKLKRLGEEMSENKNIESLSANNPDVDDKALAALESQIEQLKQEQTNKEVEIREKLKQEFSEQEKAHKDAIEEFKKKISNLKEEIKRQKNLVRPEGIKIDLSTLPDDSASEFARLYRKAKQHENLHGIARAKLHLAQEKFAELQKRYFSVCRELALSAGNKEDVAPSEARDVAESIVAKSELADTKNKPSNLENNNNNLENTEKNS